ncbi:MAG: DUF3857 domain-containing protein, partial [Candidatus Omnitrophica bacterium]|nr:DUF3857 domain-containing protein [Candidatus Omnitrophota bacterium]
ETVIVTPESFTLEYIKNTMQKKYFLTVIVGSAALSSLLLCGCSPSLDELSSTYVKTVTRHESLLKRNPGDVKLRLALARFYYRFKDYEKVKALTFDAHDKEVKIMCAKATARLKDSTALDLFEKLGEIEDSEYLYLYGQVLEEKNLYPKAIEIYKKVKPPFKEQAQYHIAHIGIKIDGSISQSLQKLLDEEAPFIAQIDKEEAVTLKAEETFEIKSDNTSVATMYIAQKVLKENGKGLAEVELEYDSTYEKIELEYARTITSDGKVVYAGRENIRDVSKYLNFPLYSNVHVLIISMPSVDVGSIIEYKAKIYSSKLINTKDFSFIYHLKERFPIARADFTLIVPKEANVKFKFLNEEYAAGVSLAPRLEETAAGKTYSWHFKEIEAIIPEAGMPPLSQVNPAAAVSSFDSWEEVYSWWRDLYKDKISLNKEVEGFLKNLIKDCPDELSKAKKIYEFCAKDIRYVALEYGDGGYEPHRAVDIFWNRYGDCKDKAMLLVAMLKQAGFHAYPVLIPTRGAYSIDATFPSANFNHAIAALRYNDEIIFMDPTASTTSFGDLPLDDQERNVLVFFDDGYKVLTTPLMKENETLAETTMDINDDEDAVVARRITTKGYFAAFQRFYFKNTHPQNIRDGLQERVAGINPSSQLRDYRIDNLDDFDKPPVLIYTFDAKKILNPAKNLRIIPLFGDIDINSAYASKSARIFPVEFDGISKKMAKVRVNVPASITVKYLPENKDISTEWFDYRASYAQSGNSLDFYQEFAIKKRFVAKERYQEFKNALERVLYFLREEIILQKQ